MLIILIRYVFKIVITKIKSFFSVLILEYILGWDIINSTERQQFNLGKHVIVYTHTSFYEHLIGYLLSLRYQIPLIFLAESELKEDPITGIFLKLMDLIYVDRKKDTDIVMHITTELMKYDDHMFAVSMDTVNTVNGANCNNKQENTDTLIFQSKNMSQHISERMGDRVPMHTLQKQTSQSFQGFYQIALKTNSQIHQAIFDFENQIMRIENIKICEYEEMITKLSDGFKKEIPYCQEKMLHKVNKTSLFNMNKSILFYFPPLFVIYVLLNIFF